MRGFIDSLLSFASQLGRLVKKQPNKRNRSRGRKLRAESLENRNMMTVWTVNYYEFDEQDGIADNQVSIRDAVDVAVAGDTIEFSPSLNGKTIQLDRNLGNFGEIVISKNLTIDASKLPLGVTLDAGTSLGDQTPGIKDGLGMRIFNITAGNVTMKNLTLKGADTYGTGGAINAIGNVSLTLDTVTLRDNGAAERGGGLYFETVETLSGAATTRLSVSDSLFQNNSAASTGSGGVLLGDGGGVFIALGGYGFPFHRQALGQRVSIERSQFLGNTALNRGGGIAAWQGAGAEVTVAESTISGNVAGTQQSHGTAAGSLQDAGGGFYSYLFSGDEKAKEYNGTTNPFNQNGIAKLTITGSTIDNNVAGTYGGGIAICAKREDSNAAVVSKVGIVNSTISGNLVLRNGTTSGSNGFLGKGGGVAVAVYPNDIEEGLETHFQNATVANNRAEEGGGIWSMVPADAASVVRTWLTNTIVSGNTNINVTVPNNLSGSFDVTATQYNLIGAGNTLWNHANHAPNATFSASTNVLNLADSQHGLTPLANYGGGTRTHALYPSSPAVDRGSDALAVTPFTSTSLVYDQRGAGFDRKVDFPGVDNLGAGTVDIGAYELGKTLRVTNVTIKSSIASPILHPPVSFNGLNDATDRDGWGRQLQTVPIADIDTVTITFDQVLGVILSSHLGNPYGLKSNLERTLASGGFSSSANTASWTFSTWLPTDQWLISLSDGVTSSAGTNLDGEWNNPGRLFQSGGSGAYYQGPVVSAATYNANAVSKFPSGNDAAGGAFKFVFTVMHGDTQSGSGTFDNFVDVTDLGVYGTYYGTTGHTFAEGDCRGGDGTVDVTDHGAMATNWQVKLQQLIFADLNNDDLVTQADIDLWDAGTTRDLNQDGAINAADKTILDNQKAKLVAFYWVNS